MGMWIELGLFALVFVFALHQWNDLKKEQIKRQSQQKEGSNKTQP